MWQTTLIMFALLGVFQVVLEINHGTAGICLFFEKNGGSKGEKLSIHGQAIRFLKSNR